MGTPLGEARGEVATFGTLLDEFLGEANGEAASDEYWSRGEDNGDLADSSAESDNDNGLGLAAASGHGPAPPSPRRNQEVDSITSRKSSMHISDAAAALAAA